MNEIDVIHIIPVEFYINSFLYLFISLLYNIHLDSKKSI